MIRELIMDFLLKKQFTVVEASNGLEALKRVRDEGNLPDLVITDLVMPAMGGMELLAELRRDQPGIAALFVSGYYDDFLALTEALDEKTRFLEKPFDFRKLEAHVEALLPAASAEVQKPAVPWDRQPARQKTRPTTEQKLKR